MGCVLNAYVACRISALFRCGENVKTNLFSGGPNLSIFQHTLKSRGGGLVLLTAHWLDMHINGA